MRKTDFMKGQIHMRKKWMSSERCLETGILGFHFFLRQDLLVVSCFRFLKGSSDLEYVKLWEESYIPYLSAARKVNFPDGKSDSWSRI